MLDSCVPQNSLIRFTQPRIYTLEGGLYVSISVRYKPYWVYCDCFVTRHLSKLPRLSQICNNLIVTATVLI